MYIVYIFSAQHDYIRLYTAIMLVHQIDTDLFSSSTHFIRNKKKEGEPRPNLPKLYSAMHVFVCR